MTDDGGSSSRPTTPGPWRHQQGARRLEYVDGRPQLITPGTGETRRPDSTIENSGSEIPGLVGVSANGADVYFSTYDTLVTQDHNGLFLKFYDARSGGGFSAPPRRRSARPPTSVTVPAAPNPRHCDRRREALGNGGNWPARDEKKAAQAQRIGLPQASRECRRTMIMVGRS